MNKLEKIETLEAYIKAYMFDEDDFDELSHVMNKNDLRVLNSALAKVNELLTDARKSLMASPSDTNDND
jgi:hypothetical protein